MRHDVHMDGWHVSGAGANATSAGWRYTVGLHQTYQHPEVVVVGLAPQTMQAVLEAIVHQVRRGHRFETGDRYDAILVRYACAFERVDRRKVRRYLPDAVTFYGAVRFPALQCLWPDRAGRFPFDGDCDAAVREVQRCLFCSAAGTLPAGSLPGLIDPTLGLTDGSAGRGLGGPPPALPDR